MDYMLNGLDEDLRERLDLLERAEECNRIAMELARGVRGSYVRSDGVLVVFDGNVILEYGDGRVVKRRIKMV